MARRYLAFLTLAVLLSVVLIPAPRSDAQVTPDVVISEIHYHPQAVGTTYPDFDDRENTEFIELLNLESTTVDLGGWCLDAAVDYCFAAGTSLAYHRPRPDLTDSGYLPATGLIGSF